VETIPTGRLPVWFGSNHDHSRMATRWAGGDVDKHRAALFLLLTLPGVAILYQGDEIALQDGRVPKDRIRDIATPAARPPSAHRSRGRRSAPSGRTPWLPLTDTSRNVRDTRDVMIERATFSDDSYETLPSDPGVWPTGAATRPACST